jgi:hypothetical protein
MDPGYQRMINLRKGAEELKVNVKNCLVDGRFSIGRVNWW